MYYNLYTMNLKENANEEHNSVSTVKQDFLISGNNPQYIKYVILIREQHKWYI